nr:phage tail sheath-like protein [Escherichia coli 9.0111]
MINFDGIGNDRRIPLIEVEFNNSMAVTGTPAQRQCVLLFGQARMKENAVDGAGVLDVPVRITRASQATEFWGRGSMIALMVRNLSPSILMLNCMPLLRGAAPVRLRHVS